MAISKKRKIDSSGGGSVLKAVEMNAVEEVEIDFEVFSCLCRTNVKYPVNLIELADYLVQPNEIDTVFNENDEVDSDNDLDEGQFDPP